MNKINFSLVIALGIIVATPTINLAMQFDTSALRQRAAGLLEKAKAANPNPKYWADKTAEKAKRMWFCFKKGSGCSNSEVAQARAWIIGVPTAVATALLVAAGVMVSNRLVERAKQEAESGQTVGTTIPANFMPILAGIIQRNVSDLRRINRASDMSSQLKETIKMEFERFFPQYVANYADFYEDDGLRLKDSILNQGIQYIKSQQAPDVE